MHSCRVSTVFSAASMVRRVGSDRRGSPCGSPVTTSTSGGRSACPATLDGVIERIKGSTPTSCSPATLAAVRWSTRARLGGADRVSDGDHPGNHDARNVGYSTSPGSWRTLSGYRAAFEPDRAERLRATGFTLARLVGARRRRRPGRAGLVPVDRRAVRGAGRHTDRRRASPPRVSIPGTGRERNIVFDAGDLLHTLVDLDVDVILSGHRHVPASGA